MRLLFLTLWWSTLSAGDIPDRPRPSIRIGVSNVQSGPSSSLGRQLTQGSVTYFDLVNASGGVHGRSIEVLVKDDRYEPDPAVQNTNDLITKDRAFFLFDYVGTPTLTRVLPLLRYFDQEKVVNVAPFTGADPQRRPPYDKYVFNIRASYREETRALVDHLFARGIRKIGFLGQADAYGKSGEIGVADALGRHGLTVVGSVTYTRNQSFDATMKTQVDVLRSRGAEAVIAVGVYGPCAAFIRDARLVGWNIPIANVSFVNAQAMLDALKEESKARNLDLTANLLNSQVVPTPEDLQLPLVKSYREHMTPSVVGFTSLEGWLNAVVVTEALRRAGPNPSKERFIDAMESLAGWDPGIGQRLEFTHTHHQGLRSVWLTKTDNGRWVPVVGTAKGGQL